MNGHLSMGGTDDDDIDIDDDYGNNDSVDANDDYDIGADANDDDYDIIVLGADDGSAHDDDLDDMFSDPGSATWSPPRTPRRAAPRLTIADYMGFGTEQSVAVADEAAVTSQPTTTTTTEADDGDDQLFASLQASLGTTTAVDSSAATKTKTKPKTPAAPRGRPRLTDSADGSKAKPKPKAKAKAKAKTGTGSQKRSAADANALEVFQLKAPPKRVYGPSITADSPAAATASSSGSNTSALRIMANRFREQKSQEETAQAIARRGLAQSQERFAASTQRTGTATLDTTAAMRPPPRAVSLRVKSALADQPFAIAELPRHSSEIYSVAMLSLRHEQEQHIAKLDHHTHVLCQLAGAGNPQLQEHACAVREHARRLYELAAQVQAQSEERQRILTNHTMLSRPLWDIETGAIAAVQKSSAAAAAAAAAAPSSSSSVADTPPPPPPPPTSFSASIGSFTSVRAVPPLSSTDTVAANALFRPGYTPQTAGMHSLGLR
jgi:hypothetical protein